MFVFEATQLNESNRMNVTPQVYMIHLRLFDISIYFDATLLQERSAFDGFDKANLECERECGF